MNGLDHPRKLEGVSPPLKVFAGSEGRLSVVFFIFYSIAPDARSSGGYLFASFLCYQIDESADQAYAHDQVEDGEKLGCRRRWRKIAEPDRQNSNNAKVEAVEPTPPFDPVVEVGAPGQ